MVYGVGKGVRDWILCWRDVAQPNYLPFETRGPGPLSSPTPIPRVQVPEVLSLSSLFLDPEAQALFPSSLGN